MCGRYAQPWAASQARQELAGHGLDVEQQHEGDGHTEHTGTYNLAPGNRGLVIRTMDTGNAQDQVHDSDPNPEDVKSGDKDGASAAIVSASQPRSRSAPTLQLMRWGLVPSWTKGDPKSASFSKTINCRAERLASPGGIWASMKAKKRCVVIALGFYEWLKRPSVSKRGMPHFIRRADGKPMLFAGLWDSVRYQHDGGLEEYYTYTVITTAANDQMRSLHDRMPAILDFESEQLSRWLDPDQNRWNDELQGFLAPFDGQLDIYPVSPDVGRVGNDSPSFVIPLDDRSLHKGHIANFFATPQQRDGTYAESDTKLAPELSQKVDSHSRRKNQTTRELKRTPSPQPESEIPPKQRRLTVPEKHTPSPKSRNAATKQVSSSPRKITDFFARQP